MSAPATRAAAVTAPFRPPLDAASPVRFVIGPTRQDLPICRGDLAW